MPTLSSQIVKREVATVQDVEEALARQAQHGGDLVTNLLELAKVSEERLTHALAESVGMPPAPAGELPAAPERIRRLVPGDIAQRYGLYPLEEADGTLAVAVSEPLPAEVASDLEFSLGLTLVQRAATRIRVQQAVSRDYGMRLDHRAARLIARLSGAPDPYPSLSPPAPGAAALSVQPAREVDEPAREVSDVPRERAEPSQPVLPLVTRAGTRRSVDWQSLTRAEARPEQQRRRLGPYTAAMAELDLVEAETRDDVVAAFFDFASQYFEYAALFAVHGDLAEGRDANGSGAPRAKVLSIGVPLELPSTLSSVVASEPYRLARLSASGLDGALAKDLERRPGPIVLLLPIRVRDRTVLVLYGDHGENNVQLDSVGDVISFAPLVAAAFERVILRRKGRAAVPKELPTAAFRDRQRVPRAPLPNKHDRASALASALVDPPLRGTFISTTPPAPAPERRLSDPASPALSSIPALARPVISVGPSRPISALARDVAIPGAPRAPNEARDSASDPPMPPPSLPHWVARSRTPIPSSFAPGAPPHPSSPVSRPPTVDPATDAGWENVVQANRAPERSATPIQMPAPPPRDLPSRPRSPLPPPDEPSRPLPPVQSRPAAPRPSSRSETPRSTPSARRLVLVPDSEPAPGPDDEGVEVLLGAESYEEIPQSSGTPLAPNSRSIAHSARPLPAPGHSVELRLPTVIVDLAQDTEELVQRVIEGDREAAERLVEIGAGAVPALVGAFPGPITAELRRGVGDGPPRASLCGPLLSVLARIGPRAAGVLSVRTNDRNAGVRAWATRLLGEMPCMDAAHAVARRFIDEDPEVRRAALAAGRMLQTHGASVNVLAGTLTEMLLDSARNEGIVHLAIEAVADLREPRAIPALATLLDTASVEVQRSAHWALVVLTRTDYGDNAAAWDQWWRVNASRHRIEWLIDALMHDSQEIRRAAGDELKSLTKEYFGYYDDLPARERERAQQRYREWWDTKGKARFT